MYKWHKYIIMEVLKSMKFFKKVCLETGYDPFDDFNRGFIIACYVFLMLFPPAALIFPVILIIRNLKLKKIKYMILFLALQLVLGIPLTLLWFYQIYERTQGNGTNKRMERQVWSQIAWSGDKSTDDERAKSFGYASVADAIENGIDYNGNKIF